MDLVKGGFKHLGVPWITRESTRWITLHQFQLGPLTSPRDS